MSGRGKEGGLGYGIRGAERVESGGLAAVKLLWKVGLRTCVKPHFLLGTHRFALPVSGTTRKSCGGVPIPISA